MKGWESFNRIVYKMLSLAYLNILWILFTLLGLVILGLFPATAALFALCRKIIQGDEKITIFSTFWMLFRQEFLRMNGFSLLFLVVGYLLYFDFIFLQMNSGQYRFLFPVLVFILVSTVVTLLNFFPVYVHFDLKFFQYFKQSFLFAITAPLSTLAIAGTGTLIIVVTFIFPGIILLFSASGFAYVSTYVFQKTVDRLENRTRLTGEKT